MAEATGPAGMIVFQVGIVIIENMTRDAVDESGVHDVEAFAAPEKRCLRRARERAQRRRGDIHRLMMRASDGDAHPVQQRSHSFFANVLRQIVISGRDQITSEGFRDVRRRLRGSIGRLLCTSRRRSADTVSETAPEIGSIAAHKTVLRSMRGIGIPPISGETPKIRR
jgi:hypothetical protein